MAKALRDAIPGLDSFLTKTENNTRARVLMAYCKPLFDQSHQLEFGLQLSLLPTKRSIYLNGGEEINQFPSQSASGEGLSDTSYSTANAMTTKEQEAMARQIYNWMMDHGVPEIQAFAILGNMQGESGMNPSKHESGKPWHLGGLGLASGLQNAGNSLSGIWHPAIQTGEQTGKGSWSSCFTTMMHTIFGSSRHSCQ